MPYVCSNLIVSEGDYNSHDKRLSICLSGNGFSFAETTTSGLLLTFGQAEGEHPHTITEATREIKAFFASVGINPLGYAATELVVQTDEHTWVPDELYVPSANRIYLNLVGGKSSQVVAVQCKEVASTSVFAADDQLLTAFKVALPGISVLNQHVKLLKFMSRSANHPVIATNWRKPAVDVAIFRDGRYLFSGSIPLAGSGEALFTIVELMKQHAADGPSTELVMMGEVGRDTYENFRPYFPSVTLFLGEATRFTNPAFKQLRTYRHALMLM